ncbi:DUF305 domain-containing protein [Microbacterium sulfonylureivorans]|uniref:DUF305 domain-containing protein n=1 Tax=Microbacterium sulfonylureivorans TaxID=2486854 RepID=UPI000FDB5FA4|nr:DUF305 domain-containing protein [Microbacterium sulfonylureivorans]
MKLNRLAALAAAPAVLTLALAGCAAGAGDTGMPGMSHGPGMSSPSASTQTDVSMADSMFAMMMIPHHQQAIEMSDMILAKSGVDERVRELATQIKAAQGPEIELMEGWLREWGMPSSGGADDMGHGDGMMSADDMAALESAEGSAAARLFLEQMIEHHEGAIEMAEEELRRGSDPDVLALAERIIEAQAAEIDTMRELLTQI